MAVEWNKLSKHYFTYDENGVEFFKSFEELMKSPARKEDMYVYKGELDEDNYDDDADDYRELNAIDYMFEWIETINKQNELCRSLVKKEYQPAVKELEEVKQEKAKLEKQLEEVKQENKELEEDAEKIEEIVRNSKPLDILDNCLRVWYDDEDGEVNEVDEVVKYDQDEVNEQISEYVFDVISNEGFDEDDFDEEDFNFEEWVHNIKLAKEELKDFKEDLEEEWDCHLGEFADAFDISCLSAEITDRREEVDELKENIKDVRIALESMLTKTTLSKMVDVVEVDEVKEEKEELEQQLLVWSTELYQYGKYPHEVYKSICEMEKKGQYESDVSFIQGVMYLSDYDAEDIYSILIDVHCAYDKTDFLYIKRIFDEIYADQDYIIKDGNVVDLDEEDEE